VPDDGNVMILDQLRNVHIRTVVYDDNVITETQHIIDDAFDCFWIIIRRDYDYGFMQR
jgi:hypothetical protein